MKHLREGEGHAPADDHLVDLARQVLDELNLVRNFRATEDRKHRPRWVVEHLRESGELLLNQCARDLHLVALADHGRMSAVRGAESVVHVDVPRAFKLLRNSATFAGSALILLPS